MPQRRFTAQTRRVRRFLRFTPDSTGRTPVLPLTMEEPVRFSLFGLIYLAIGVVVALSNGYNSIAGLSEILSLLIAVILWPLVLLGVDLHLPPIAT